MMQAKADVHVVRSLEFLAQALRENLSLVPVRETQWRFAQLLSQYLIADSPEDAQRLCVSLKALLDSDVAADLETVDLESLLLADEATQGALSELSESRELFAQNVRRRMQQLNLDQNSLAERLDTTQSNVSELISGRHRPQKRTLMRLAEALECSLETLWPSGN